MKAGRELDALVAEKVMGKKIMRWMHLPNDQCIDIETSKPPLPYSTDIDAAWMVIEKMLKGNRWEFTIESDDGEWEARCNAHISRQDYNESQYYARAMSAPHAICLAALKAVGYEVQE